MTNAARKRGDTQKPRVALTHSGESVMGDAWVVREDLTPPRVHPQRWPNQRELEHLRNAATDPDTLP